MNKSKIRRLINEYMDGEIGLADKAELERIMAQDGDVRTEYKELRRIGMLMSSVPEVTVHPHAFRAKMLDALDGQQRTFFTPQRAFAVSMLVTMLVIGLTFGMNIYQARLFGGESEPMQLVSEAGAPSSATLAINIAATPERYFERLLLEVQLGYSSDALLSAVAAQSSVYEGAACLPDGVGHGHIVQFGRPLAKRHSLVLSAAEVGELGKLVEELDGRAPAVALEAGTQPLGQYLASVPAGQRIAVELRFP